MTTKVEILDSVSDFLKQSPLPHCIGDRSPHSINGHLGQVINPSDGAPLCSVAYGDKKDIDAAVKAAHKAHLD